MAGPYPADACRPPSAPCGVGAGPTNWTALQTWQPLGGHAPPTNRTSPASRRPPRIGTIPLLTTGKPLRGETPSHLQSSCVIAAWLECFPEKSSWCRNEQVCEGVKCKVL